MAIFNSYVSLPEGSMFASIYSQNVQDCRVFASDYFKTGASRQRYATIRNV